MNKNYPIGTIIMAEPEANGLFTPQIGVVLDHDGYGRCLIKWNDGGTAHLYNVTDMDRFFKKV